jgi:hypothetical protein
MDVPAAPPSDRCLSWEVVMSASRCTTLFALLYGAASGVGCGPAHLSALGNPGDYCTESTACTDGSECRQAEDGFRCVERGAPPPRSSDSRPGPTGDLGDEGAPVGDVGVDPRQDEALAAGAGGAEEADAAPAPDDEGYVPPSRRRRGQ